MPRLVALDIPGSDLFVEQLRKAWDAGDAVFPVDQRISNAAKRALMVRFGADCVVTSDGNVAQLDSGLPTEVGDALVVATSGSSGDPKGVVLTRAAVAASAVATSARLRVSASDSWLACLPLSHVGGLSVVTRAMHTGTALTVLPAFDSDTVNRSDATLVSLVPTVLNRVDPTRFRAIVLGGFRPPDDLPNNAVTTYGMTETGSGVVYSGVPLDGVEVRSVGGELQLKCPMLLRCYRDMTDPLIDGWYRTGDLGDVDAAGFVTVHGRSDDLIITGGENVWPEPVESILRGRTGVSDVVVMGVDDDEWGQLVTAFVVPSDPLNPVSLEALRGVVKQHLPGFCAPRLLVLVDSIPRTELGKVKKTALHAPR